MTIVNTKKHRGQRRIGFSTEPMDGIFAISDGLIGNVTWLTELLATKWPPANMAGMKIGHLISIDDMGIYGESLWHLFKHTMDGDIDRFSAISNALQDRTITAGDIREAARDYKNDKLKAGLFAKAGIEMDQAPEADETPQPRF